MLSSTLPTELGISVINCIGEDADAYHKTTRDAKYLRTLCICAVVCKDWLHRSRVNLYWSIFIDDPVRFDSLKRTLDRNPSFLHLIRSVYVTPSESSDKEPLVPFRHALLFLRRMPSSVITLSVYGSISFDNVTRRCLSLGYPHIVHLRLEILAVPINRIHHLINAFPSLRTVSYSEPQAFDLRPKPDTYVWKYSVAIRSGRASRLPEKDVPLKPDIPYIRIHQIEGYYVAHLLRHRLECMKTEACNWIEDAGLILSLSKFPLLRSLTLQLDPSALHRSLEVVVKLLTQREPCPSLHTLTLLLDGVFDVNPYNDGYFRIEELSGGEYHTFYGEIDDILGDEQHDPESTVPSLTVKLSKGLPRNIVNRLTGALQDGFPKLYRRGSLKTDFIIGGKQLNYYVGDVAISSDRKFVARTRKNKVDPSETMVVVCDPQTGTASSIIEAEQVLAFIPSPRGHSEDYILLVKEGSLVICDRCCGTDIARLDGPSDINGDGVEIWRAVHTSQNLLVVHGTNGSIFAWDTRNFALLYPLNLSKEEDSKVKSPHADFVHISANEKWLLMHAYTVSHSDYQIFVWNTVTWTLHAVLSHHEGHNDHCWDYKTSVLSTTMRKSWSPRARYRIVAAAFSGDGTSIVTVCRCGALQRWSCRTGVLLSNTFLANQSRSLIHSLDHLSFITELSPDGRRVCWVKETFVGDQDKIVNMSNAETGALLWSDRAHPHNQGRRSMNTIFFSPDGQYVVTRSADSNQWRLRRAVNGECIIMDKCDGPEWLWTFSPSGKALVVTSTKEDDETIYVTKL